MKILVNLYPYRLRNEGKYRERKTEKKEESRKDMKELSYSTQHAILTLTVCYFEINFNISFPSTLRSPK